MTSVVGVINLYGTVPTSTVEKIGMLIGALVPPILVLVNKNAPPVTTAATTESSQQRATAGAGPA